MTSFTVNNAHTTATVNESDSILFKCAARGRPTLNFQLSRNGSNLSQSRHNSTCHADAMLTTTMLRARCEDAGLYTCEVHDGVGNPDQRTVTVFVNCKFPIKAKRTFHIKIKKKKKKKQKKKKKAGIFSTLRTLVKMPLYSSYRSCKAVFCPLV